MIKKRLSFIIVISILSIFAVITLYPLFFVFVSSFKNNAEFYSSFFGFPSKLRWNNYVQIASSVLTWLKNSGIYSSLNVLLDLTIASLAGYAFARFNFKYKEFFFMLVIMLMMMPGVLLVIPMYVEVVNWHGLNTIWALILPWTASDAPLGVFILRRFFQTQPMELFEAAKVDGASEFRIFTQIAIPLAAPALTIVAILDILFTLNDFLWPLLIMTKNSTEPLAVGMMNYSGSSGGVITWGNIFAAYALAMIPMIIVFALFAKNFVNAITEGAIK